MAEYKIQSETLTSIADAIRSKAGETGSLSPSQMVSAIENISSDGATEDNIEKLLTGELTEYTNNTITKIVSPLRNCSKITKISLTSCTEFGTAYALAQNSLLREINLPLLTKDQSYTFFGNSSLETIDLPFYGAVTAGAFQNCTKLNSVNIPVATSLNNSAFNGCKVLSILDLPLVKQISSSVFTGCSALIAVILRSETVVSLNNVNSFNNTPIGSGTGYIYVPSILVDTYKAAANWSTYASQFRALEDYTVDGTITGGLDSTKI